MKTLHYKLFTGAIIAVTGLLCFCADNALFDPSNAATVRSYAFISDSLHRVFTLADTTKYLSKYSTAAVNRKLAFAGIVVPANAPVTPQWSFDDNVTATADTITNIHAFSVPSLHSAFFKITDNNGKSHSETCFVYVNRTTLLTGLGPITPADRRAGVPTTGITFSWAGIVPVSAGATKADLFLSTSPVSLTTPAIPLINGTNVIFTNTLLDSTVYFWRVVVTKSVGGALVDTSITYQFRTGT
jgi:hypothetical protein